METPWAVYIYFSCVFVKPIERLHVAVQIARHKRFCSRFEMTEPLLGGVPQSKWRPVYWDATSGFRASHRRAFKKDPAPPEPSLGWLHDRLHGRVRHRGHGPRAWGPYASRRAATRAVLFGALGLDGKQPFRQYPCFKESMQVWKALFMPPQWPSRKVPRSIQQPFPKTFPPPKIAKTFRAYP